MLPFQPIGKPKWCEKINPSFDLNVEHFAIRRISSLTSGCRKYHCFIYRRLLHFSPLTRSWVNSCCHFFPLAVLSFMFIYLECCCQDCRYLQILLNGRKKLQLWWKYNKPKYLFWPLPLLFWRRKAEQRCLRDCLADLALAHFVTCQLLGVTHLPGSGDVSAKGKVTLLVRHRL